MIYGYLYFRKPPYSQRVAGVITPHRATRDSDSGHDYRFARWSEMNFHAMNLWTKSRMIHYRKFPWKAVDIFLQRNSQNLVNEICQQQHHITSPYFGMVYIGLIYVNQPPKNGRFMAERPESRSSQRGQENPVLQ